VRWHAAGVADHARFSLVCADVCDIHQVRRMVAEQRPTQVYHLAAISSVAESFDDPVGTLHNNVAAQVSVLDAVRAEAPEARVLIVSSSEIYGRAAAGALDEESPLRPENPYAVSKATQDLLAYQYGVAYEVDIVRVRAFNHIGPGQSDRFVASSFGRQIAEIEAGRREPVMHVGNLRAQRDFTDVRDVVRGYALALLRGERGAAYNLGTGSGVSIDTLLSLFVERSSVVVTVEVAPERLRRADAPIMLADHRRLRARTQWEPTIPLSATVDDILTYWRTEIDA
jgi:GDP-4-dehydro-6-deoxy-D-mannose reductase